MILLIRPYLLFFLILLQFAAPLIHAHKNNATNFSASIHLPEFEQVNAFLKHAPEFIAPTNHDEGVIAVSTGIKNEPQPLSQMENTIFVLLLSVFLLAKVKRHLSNFSLQTEPIPDSHFLNLASPRAPPFTAFC